MSKDLMNINENILKQPGDEVSIKMTKNKALIAKANLNNGKEKHSYTKYPNGTIHETRTIKP